MQRDAQEEAEGNHIESLVGEHTNLNSDDIPTIVEHLHNYHIKSRSEGIELKGVEVMEMTWQTTDPILPLARTIENTKNLENQARTPRTD